MASPAKGPTGKKAAKQPRRRGVRAWWGWFWSPSSRISIGLLFIAGIVVGAALLDGFNATIRYTNTEKFCLSCHEMREFLYKEYQRTIHYSNRTGVRAVCADCHVPKDRIHKLARKIMSVSELYHKILGTIATREKFEARRLRLAEKVWRAMEESDSRECRNCHNFKYMDFSAQKRRPKRKHRAAMREKKTCIECHKGIAHRLPRDYEKD